MPMWDIGDGAGDGGRGVLWPTGRDTDGGACPNTPLLFSEYKCSVFYGAPTKSKLLSTLCSADVCQCAEGEPRAGGRVGRVAWPGPASHLGL